MSTYRAAKYLLTTSMSRKGHSFVKNNNANHARSIYLSIRFSTHAKKDDQPQESQQIMVPVSSTPPYAVRALLVGSSVGLASPIFGVAGAAYFWFNYMPKSQLGSLTKYSVGLLAGGGMSKLTYSYIWPFLMNNAELVLPFAVANGISAAFWFSVGEAIFGLDKLAGTAKGPMDGSSAAVDGSMLPHLKNVVNGEGLHLATGPVVGGLTALTAPFLWPYLFPTLWPVDL
jgi:hypothetical protein